MPSHAGNILMALPVSKLTDHHRCTLYIVVLALCLWHGLTPTVAHAEAPTLHDYFLQEPVFGGQARIVEAGSAYEVIS